MTESQPSSRSEPGATGVTLAALVGRGALGLTVLAGADALARPVRWVHTSELDDPTPYLEGGELLLTTGLKLGPSADELRSYVHRLADAGVAAIGFGVGLTYAEVPEALVEAAAERGLPLLRVPQPTPFIALSKTVTAALAAEQYQAVTISAEAQQEFTRAALGKDGPTAVVRALARRLGGWAALYDASGELAAAAPDWAARRARRLRPEVERLRTTPAPASAALQGDGDGDAGEGCPDWVVLQSLGADRRARGYLAVGTEGRLTPTERYVVNAAVALLTLTLERSRELRRAEERMAAALLRLLLAGEAETARDVATPLFGGLPADPLRLLLAAPAEREEAPAAGDPLALLADRVEQAAARGGERVLVSLAEGRLVLLATDGGAAYRAGVEAAAEVPGLAVGVSSPSEPGGVGAARAQAERALAVALRGGRPLVEHEEVGAGSLVPLLSDEAVRAYAEGLLRPLREHDASARGDLVASLRAWLSRHGQWDAAAADLGVHRHTLRYRIRRVEELLGRSLDDTDVRMELWFALRVEGEQ